MRLQSWKSRESIRKKCNNVLRWYGESQICANWNLNHVFVLHWRWRACGDRSLKYHPELWYLGSGVHHIHLLATLRRRLSGYRRRICVLRKSRLIRDNVACLEIADFARVGHNYLCAPLPVVLRRLLRYVSEYSCLGRIHCRNQSWGSMARTRIRLDAVAKSPSWRGPPSSRATLSFDLRGTRIDSHCRARDLISSMLGCWLEHRDAYRAGQGPRQDIRRIERTYRHAHRWRGQFLYEPPTLHSVVLSFAVAFFLFLPASLFALFLPFLLPENTLRHRGFSRGVEEFFELTPTCSTAVRFLLFRTKDPKWRLVRRSFFSLLPGLSTLSHLARVCARDVEKKNKTN